MKKIKNLYCHNLAVYFFITTLILSCNEEKVITDKSNESAIQAIDKLNMNLTSDKIINIGFDASSNKYYYEIKDGFEEGFAKRGEPGDILCKGSGVSFARCVKRYLDNGKILKVYKKDDEYIAEEAYMIPLEELKKEELELEF